ncbi:MAG TPA: T9SS type A sorting domain-containing protein [Bacteroidia bacterium]|nr:T9SS type A sorting domain-containing protein [Bacteroidia bacterium]
MKKIIPGLLLLLLSHSARSQNGLESVIVERYYVSDANDATMNSTGGILPVGSVTYRVFVDLLPGYKFQAAYGVPDHELRIETTTLFFNNEDRGATAPTYTKNQASQNTVMLDSWLSVGAACSGNFGVMKSLDDGLNNVTNSDGVLQNSDITAGIPLTTQDGLIAGTPEAVTAVGITTEMAMFDAQNDGTNGPLFSTFNGSWASLNGSIGPDTADNKILIAQMTTNGDFSFELNIQIGTPSGGVENYVARNPIGAEILEPTLIYSAINGIGNGLSVSVPVLNVYPNPAVDNFDLEIKSVVPEADASYTIYSILGTEVIHKNLGRISAEYTEKVDVSSLSSGQYFVKISVDGIENYKRIVKN